jgi:hypothetical protein
MNPYIRFGISFITGVLFLLRFQSIAFAEPHFQSNIDTPTVAPTKTATPTPTAARSATSIPASNSLSDPKPFKAFTQADLSILTGNIQRPNGLVWYDNKIYTSCSGDWTLYEIDAETGTTSQYLYGVKNAHSILATSDDTGLSLWMPDFQSNTVTQINKGVSRNIASNLNGPWGIAPVNDGRFLISNLHTNNVIVVGSGEPQEVIKGLKSPTGIAVQADYVYVANTGSARRAIEWFSLSDLVAADANIHTSDSAVNRSLVSGLQNVTNIMVAADGYLYFNYALGTRGVVGRIDPIACREQGGCSNSEVEIVLYTELAAPLAGLTISPDMRLYVHSIYSPDIYWLDLDNTSSSP